MNSLLDEGYCREASLNELRRLSNEAISQLDPQYLEMWRGQDTAARERYKKERYKGNRIDLTVQEFQDQLSAPGERRTCVCAKLVGISQGAVQRSMVDQLQIGRRVLPLRRTRGAAVHREQLRWRSRQSYAPERTPGVR